MSAAREVGGGTKDAAGRARNRAIWISLGLVLVVMLVITWSLARTSAGSVEQAASRGESAITRSRAPGTVDLAPGSDSEDDSSKEVVVPTNFELVAPPASARVPRLKLSGVVTDTNGKAIVRYDELLDASKEASDPSTTYAVMLDSNVRAPFDEFGRYSFVELKPGRLGVGVRIPGYRPWHQQIELSRDDRNRRLDIALEPRHVLRLRVVVELESDAPEPESLRQITGDADPVASTLSCAILHDPPKERLGCGKDCEVELNVDLATGEKEGPGAPGTWVLRKALELRGDPPVFAALVIGDRVLRWKRIDSTDDDVVFSVKAAELRQNLGGVRFHVLDAHGQELARNCTCRLARPDGWAGDPRFGTVPRPALDESSIQYPGGIRLRGLHPGPIVVRIDAPGYASLHVETVVESGTERDLGEFRMTEALSIRGRVVGADGSAVPAHLHLRPAGVEAENFTAHLIPLADATADAQGRFAFDDLGRGRYLIEAHGSRGFTPASMPVLVSIEAESVEDLEIRLAPCTAVHVEIRRPPGPAVTVRLQDSQGQYAGEKWAERDDDGEFAWFFVPAGGYTARAFAKGEEIASTEFVARGQAASVVLNSP